MTPHRFVRVYDLRRKSLRAHLSCFAASIDSLQQNENSTFRHHAKLIGNKREKD